MSAANLALAKKLNVWAVIVSIAVLFLVGLMRRVKLDVGIDFSFLPPVHAILNTLTAICLLYAVAQIKQKNVENHRKGIYAAFTFSSLFLLCYVTYHFTTPETRFGGEGAIRYVYFFLLLTHIVLAAGIFPFILFTLIKGYTNQIEAHRRMARWVFPIWLYVAITGPICYLMLMPYY